MSEGEARPYSWAEVREHAQTRPAMYVGNQATAHRTAIVECLRLVWQAKVFRHPQSVRIDLSPRQYIVRAMAGPLIRPIQQIYTFGNGETLSYPWGDQNRAYFSRVAQEDEQCGIVFSKMRHRRGWRYCFSGPTGPRLGEPGYSFTLARRGAWGLRTDDGLWCEAYQEGAPVGKPFLLSEPSPVGLVVAADLDPQWFTGLPFTEEDVQKFADTSYRHVITTRIQKPSPNWTYGEIVTRWHPNDDLVSDRTLTPEGLQELLSPV